ncbi:MAG: gliding motility protein GldN [Saprospiraceae bacterium]|nr:gliding motility protein GldN [Saprospiraceae bacterium]MDW8484676.1 gliding motility protein GldN [Saprospiraceae bacterium]
MYALLRLAAFGLIFCSVGTLTFAQTYQEVRDVRTEASEPDEFGEAPLDDVVKKEIMRERRVLDYQPVRESDIMWEKRIWRIIDVREKMNLPFAYPEEPFFKILSDAAVKGDLPVYSVDDDKFRKRLSTDDVLSMMSKTDTIVTFDPETYEEKIQVVRNDINWADVKRFRIKEIWFFDKETSTMQVRILGIAPLIDVRDNEGNFRYEKAMFWIYYPQARNLLARHRVFTLGGNTNATLSWEDFLEQRYFSSFIIKESNVYDRRIEDYARGVDALWESERIKNAIFNFEQDLWQY